MKPAGAGPLAGIRVLDLTRLAPGPYCSMLLADMGAEVIVVGGGRGSSPIPEFARGKRFVILNLKTPAGRRALDRLAERADVFLEGFRPGVAAKIGCGYERLAALNPRLVYCALTGYGQDGPRARDAGHDINYIAVSGVLGALGPGDGPPAIPLNLVADFAGGSLMALSGILAALVERGRTGRGQFIDVAMVDGCLSLMAMQFPMWGTPLMPARGEGLFGAPFYRCYPCADGRHVAVGAIERPFFEALWRGLGLADAPDHFDRGNWPAIEAALSQAFLGQDAEAWDIRFRGTDACVTAVRPPDEVARDPQFAVRHAGLDGCVPCAPRFGTAPGVPPAMDAGDMTGAVLAEAGFSADEIAEVTAASGEEAITGVIWPPVFTGPGPVAQD